MDSNTLVTYLKDADIDYEKQSFYLVKDIVYEESFSANVLYEYSFDTIGNKVTKFDES